MYTFWCDYIKPKYGDKAQLCYMYADSFVIHIETEDFFRDIADDVNEWLDTSKYDKNDNRPLPIGVNKKVIDMFKGELNIRLILEFVALGAKVYAYTWQKDINQICEEKKCKGTKKYVVEKCVKFDHYKTTNFNNKTMSYVQQRFRSQLHQMNTQNVKKIGLNSRRDDKRLQTFDKVTTYPIGTEPYIVCESEMKIVLKKKHQTDKLCDRDKLAELRHIAIPMYY